MQLCVICRRFLRRNISTTKWRHGDSGLQAGPSCLLASSWPCESSTHWVNTHCHAVLKFNSSLHMLFISFVCFVPAVDWVPLLRELVSVGLKIFALCISCSLSLITIGVGWLFYRPLVAAALGAIALLPVFLARSGFPVKKNEWPVNCWLSQ